MIIHQPLRRIYRGSELVWVEDGPAQEMTPEQLYKHWLPDNWSFIFAEMDDDCSGTVCARMELYKRAAILTDDPESVRIVNKNWRWAFIRRNIHKYDPNIEEAP
jgi:hypothetical protein